MPGSRRSGTTPKLWMITNRNLLARQRGLGDGESRLSYWVSDGRRAVDGLTSWDRLSPARFRDALCDAADAFPLIENPEHHEREQHVTLFVHGYNNSWEDAARRYRQICSTLYSGRASLGLCVLFTWPSDGHKIGYYPDRLDTRRSADELAHVLATLYEHLRVNQEKTMATGRPHCRAKISAGMRDSNRRRARIDEVLDQVGLGKVAHRKVKKLSGGMVRRLGVAQALVHEPQVLVVDEPTVGLDPEERIRFRQLMTQLGRERTILLSTHIVADLGAGCREIALLDSGRTVFQGSPSELIRRALGRVFEVTVAPAEAEAIEGRYEIVSTSVSSDNVTLRGVTAGEQLPASATAVAEPNLEESYLAFMATRGRTSAARQDSGDTAAETAKGGKAT